MLFLLSFAAFAADPRVDQCDGGDGKACHDLAVDMVSKNPPRARSWAQKGCDAQDGPSCTLFGLLLAQSGQAAKGRDLLDERCTKGDTAACRGLALLLEDGQPPDDDQRAGELLKGACQAQDWTACSMLGDWFGAHPQVEDGAKNELKFYGLACDNGVEYACKRIEAVEPRR